MYENGLGKKPQWNPIPLQVKEPELVLRMKCLIANMLQFGPSKRILMQDVEDIIKSLLGLFIF
jgi:hypothetical protein